MKQLLNTNIYILQVPKEATGFTLINSHSYFNSPRIEHSLGGIDLKGKLEDWEILGTIDKDKKFDFDCEELVKHHNEMYVYFDYTKNKPGCCSSEESFLSLMEANGKYFVNPFIHPEETKQILGKKMNHIKSLLNWQQAEENTLKQGYKWLLIHKIK